MSVLLIFRRLFNPINYIVYCLPRFGALGFACAIAKRRHDADTVFIKIDEAFAEQQLFHSFLLKALNRRGIHTNQSGGNHHVCQHDIGLLGCPVVKCARIIGNGKIGFGKLFENFGAVLDNQEYSKVIKTFL